MFQGESGQWHLMLLRCQVTRRPHIEVIADLSNSYFRGATRVGTGMEWAEE